jgi:glycosyltransferase involved in cell wall biosynthesis
LKIKLASFVNKNYIKRFDGYVLLTKYMNDVVNPLQKPYIIMEGICSPEEKTPQKQNDGLFRIFYAGGRPSKDGLNYLIPAFKRIEMPNLRLDVYGDMPGVINGNDPDDNRIIYHGRTVNSIVREREFESDLLVNPRPVGEKYTYYSFPSKVLEYMSTGIPMLTTKLAGIPDEYFDYVYTIEGNSEEEYYAALVKALRLSSDELMQKGEQAKRFALNNKNYVKQAERISQLIFRLK